MSASVNSVIFFRCSNSAADVMAGTDGGIAGGLAPCIHFHVSTLGRVGDLQSKNGRTQRWRVPSPCNTIVDVSHVLFSRHLLMARLTVSFQDGRRSFSGESASAVLEYIIGLEEKTAHSY
jgi:hypothetical protein